MVSGSLTPNLVDIRRPLSVVPNKHQKLLNFKFFYVISEEGNGLFQQETVRTVIKKHDIKYGWLTPTAKCFYVGPNKRKNYWISTVFSEGGIGLFWKIPKNNPREWCQEAWYLIWLTYDNRKVVESCTNCRPNKRQNCWISTVISEGGIGLFQNIPPNTPREWCQEAWHQIWLTYDEWKVVKCCTNCATK